MTSSRQLPFLWLIARDRTSGGISGFEANRNPRSLSNKGSLWLLLIVVGLLLAGQLTAATFTVTNSLDTSGTTCAADCSLRQAISAANLAADADSIAFNIPGDGIKTIALTSSLPDIVQPLTLDGYTQPGSAPNTLVDGDNAIIKVRIRDSPAGGRGITICASNSVIRGLSITNASLFPIGVGITNAGTSCGPPADVVVEGNFIGLLPDGQTGAPGQLGLKTLGQCLRLRVGGATPAQRNVILANNIGISWSAQDGVIAGNYIGTDASGTLDRGGTGAAISLTANARRTNIGGLAPNLMAFHARGIEANNGSFDNQFFANRFQALDNIGVDLIASGSAADGVTANDPDDADAGANNLQNFPENIAVTRLSSGLSISGRIDRPATVTAIAYTIAVYANAECSAATDREGERFLGSFAFNSTNQSIETFSSITLNTTLALPFGTGITLTATDPTGNTSEFSVCTNIDAGNPTFTVNKTADSNDGACDADCSLREAISAANANADSNIIAFAIPGAGPHTLSPTSALPTITNPVLIDGYTEPGSAANTAPASSNATILVQLDGASAGASTYGLAICANNVWVRGLAITRFSVDGISFGRRSDSTQCSGTRHGRVTGNFIGIGPDGSTALANASAGIQALSSFGLIVGGNSPAERNVISRNGSGVVFNSALSSEGWILGNLFGTDASGTLDRGNSSAQIDFIGPITLTHIGTPSAPNLIAFRRASIGGAVAIGSGLRTSSFANHFSSNGGLGIDLGDDGVTANDADDADTGPNNRQNFPVISSASAAGGILTLTGTLDVPAAASLTMQLAAYESNACDPSGNGEGEIFLGSEYALIAGSAEGFQIQLPNAPAVGRIVTMTATDDQGNTSEFSACSTVADGDLVFASRFE